ncbi:MAG: hypothetical protein HYS12_17250 [Planctomycetes bacterium]|nr:hypothetical protein [Planctomycetota bacterium]
MSSQTITAPNPVVSQEVLAFAEEQGVSKLLPQFIELARQVFPMATKFDVFVEDDPEIPDRYIVLELRMRLTLPEVRAARDKWSEGFFRIYPYPRTCVFRLSLDLQ